MFSDRRWKRKCSRHFQFHLQRDMFKTYRAYVWIPMSSFDGHVCSNLFAKIWGFGDVQICGFLSKKIQVHLSWRLYSLVLDWSQPTWISMQIYLEIRKYKLKRITRASSVQSKLICKSIIEIGFQKYHLDFCNEKELQIWDNS